MGLKSSRGPTKTTTSSLFFFFLLIGKSKGAACVYLPVPKFYPTSLCEHGGGELFKGGLWAVASSWRRCGLEAR